MAARLPEPVSPQFLARDIPLPGRYEIISLWHPTKVNASEDVKAAIASIGINKCARESGFDRKNFIRKLVRVVAVKRNSYDEFVRWLGVYGNPGGPKKSGDE